MRPLLILLSLATIIGCAPADKKPKPEKKKPGTMQTAIEGFTGKTAVDSGKRAMDDIEAISAKRNADLDEALGE